MTPALPHPLRLALARTLAWALLIGGWLLLGEAGQRHWPLWAGGLLPLALWLAGIGALLAGLQGRPLPIGRLRAVLLASGATSAGTWLLEGGAPSLLVAALAWALLLVAASLSVQALRRTLPTRPPAPLWPATAGALLAWGAASAAGPGAGLASAIAAAAVALALLLPRGASPVSACRAGLFDCSLHWPDPAHCRRMADWPRQAALLAMLPMMATLPAMASWCRSDWGISASTGVLWHLAAMVLPALLARRWLARAGLPLQRSVATVLLVASGAVLWTQPGLGALMAAALLQAVAWSLAWAGPMLQPPAAAPFRGRPPGYGAAWRALASALAVLALGAATAAFGPDALRTAQGLLALLALAGGVGAASAKLASFRPSEKHP